MAVVPKQNGLDILRRLVPLNTLSDEMLSELMDAAAFEKVDKGRYLFREGDTDSHRVYLLSGSLGLLEDGREVDSVAANSNMARYPIAQHVPRRYSARAKSKVEVVRIDGGLLGDLLVRGGSSIYQVQELDPDADNDWMGQLLQSPIFQRIPAANIQNIMMRMEEVQVSNGEMVIRQGDEGDYFYLLNQGQCAVTRESESGELQEIARLRAGECFGEESLLSGRPRSSTVCMLTDGVLFRLPKSDFVEYIKLPLANAISYQDAQRRVEKGDAWLDVRSPHEHARVNIPESRNIPFNDLRQKAHELESDVSYVVYCQDGLVSSTAVYLLMELGLDAYVLERGLESVPEEDLDREETADGAQVINLRPEQEAAPEDAPDSGSVPDDEAGLLRERLHKTEAQAQEQLQRARKMKLMLEKLKGRLAETEQASQHQLEEKQRLEGELEQLRRQLKEQVSSTGSLEAQQAQLAQQLEEVTGERDRLQSELDDVCRQVGQLEKRLEGREQDETRKLKSLDEERTELQAALDRAEADLKASRAELAGVKEEEQRLQDALRQASEASEVLTADLAARETAADETLQSARQQAREQEEALRADLGQAQQQVASLEAALAERGSSEQAQLEQLAAVQQEAREREAALSSSLEQAQQQVASLEAALAERDSSEQAQSEQLAAAGKQQQLLNAERDQLQAELERAGGQINRLESERREAEQANKRQRLELEGALKSAQEAQQAAEAERLGAANERDRISAELAVLQGRYGELKQTLQERDNSLAELRQGSGEKAQEEIVKLEQSLELVRAELRESQDAAEAGRRELESLREQMGLAQAGLEDQQAMKQELASLQTEREQLGEARSSLEEALREAQEKLSGLETEYQQQQAERESLEQALEQQKAETEKLRQAAGNAPAGGDLKVLQAELATLNEALDQADQSYELLARERDELQSTLEKLQQESGASGPEQNEEAQRLAAELDAKGQELARVREEAETELQRLREQLDAERAERGGSTVDAGEREALQQALQEARNQLKELELSSSADAAEGEVLRQEIDKLRRSLEERSTELERARKESLLLEEKTEERNSEIDRLKLALEAAQVDADEVQFKKQEALDARKQVEEALYQLQKQVESERPRDDLLQPSLSASGESTVLRGGGGRRPLATLLLGAVLAFGLAEGIAIMSGKGELLSGFWVEDNRPTPTDTSALPGTSDSDVAAALPDVTSSDPSGPTVASGKSVPDAGGDAGEPPVAPARPQAEVTVAPEPLPEIQPEPVVASRPAPAEPAPAARVEPPKPARPSEPATGSPLRDRLASGGLGPEMVYIRGGEFDMGSSIHFLSREEQPVHRVEVPSFSIGRYEVTFRDYELFAAATGRRLPDDLGWGQGNRPVINVSWQDASAYAEWLSAETGRRYRLPSEAEWEYAAAAGTDTPYWWGFDLGSDRANCFNCGSQWDGASTAPVGRFEANPFGLHNTAGNVMEWVSDCYHDSYVGAPGDGSSWQEAECGERVVRGGAFNKPGESLRVTRRNRHGPDARLFVLGFRVVREVN